MLSQKGFIDVLLANIFKEGAAETRLIVASTCAKLWATGNHSDGDHRD